jgi:hypothetical protein
MRKNDSSLSEKAYRCLLYFYPAPYRRQYGELMLQLFLDIYNETQKGKRVIVLWLRLIPDIMKSVVREIIYYWISESNVEKSSLRPFGVRSFIVWVLGSGLILPLCFILLAILINLAGYDVEEDAIFMWFLAPLTVISLFGLQWRILRRHIPKASGWIWGNISALLLCGASIAITANFLDITITQEWLATVASAVIYGTFVGLAQWYVLRSYLSNVLFWIVLNISAFLSGLFIIGGSIIGIIGLALIGIIPALFTGSALLWLLRAKQDSIHI